MLDDNVFRGGCSKQLPCGVSFAHGSLQSKIFCSLARNRQPYAEEKSEEVVASASVKGNLGITVEQITPDVAEKLGLQNTRGVVITAVAPNSVGDEAGLQPGDIIREIDRKPIRDLSDFRKNMESAAQGKSVLFLVQRQDNTVFFALRADT